MSPKMKTTNRLNKRIMQGTDEENRNVKALVRTERDHESMDSSTAFSTILTRTDSRSEEEVYTRRCTHTHTHTLWPVLGDGATASAAAAGSDGEHAWVILQT